MRERERRERGEREIERREREGGDKMHEWGNMIQDNCPREH